MSNNEIESDMMHGAQWCEEINAISRWSYTKTKWVWNNTELSEMTQINVKLCKMKLKYLFK